MSSYISACRALFLAILGAAFLGRSLRATRRYHAFWKLYGIGLPDEVLKKVYYKNALTITPRLLQTGWPR